MFTAINTEGIYCILSALMMCHFVFFPGNLPSISTSFWIYLEVILDVIRCKPCMLFSKTTQAILGE